MTQNDSSPPLADDFKAELVYAQARKTGKRFWIISGLWALSLVVLGVLFGSAISRFDEATGKIEGLEQRATELLGRLEDVQQLQELHTNIYALRLQAEEELRTLSDQEWDFLEQVLQVAGRAEKSERTAEELRILANNAFFEGGRERPNPGWEEFYRQAILNYRELVTRNESDVISWRRMGEAQFKLQEWQAAIESFSAAIEAENDPPRSYDPLKLRGLAQLMVGDLGGALESFDAAAEHAEQGLAAAQAQKGGSRTEYHARRLAGATENKGLVFLRQSDWRAALDNTDVVIAVTQDYKPMSWNYLIRSIAADKLENRALADEAHARWLESASKRDAEALGPFLAEDVRPYLEQIPGR